MLCASTRVHIRSSRDLRVTRFPTSRRPKLKHQSVLVDGKPTGTLCKVRAHGSRKTFSGRAPVDVNRSEWSQWCSGELCGWKWNFERSLMSQNADNDLLTFIDMLTSQRMACLSRGLLPINTLVHLWPLYVHWPAQLLMMCCCLCLHVLSVWQEMQLFPAAVIHIITIYLSIDWLLLILFSQIAAVIIMRNMIKCKALDWNWIHILSKSKWWICQWVYKCLQETSLMDDSVVWIHLQTLHMWPHSVFFSLCSFDLNYVAP